MSITKKIMDEKKIEGFIKKGGGIPTENIIIKDDRGLPKVKMISMRIPESLLAEVDAAVLLLKQEADFSFTRQKWVTDALRMRLKNKN